ncbi:MAG TPA: DNA polymerase III subunit gamma/tau [Thermoanaerobaculia bacterium]|nr:DNA polymerase III subunit gamma/tau [Thermoanaerobaculia bacterium]
MSYQALARKYRPQTFGDIIGQETIVRTLQNAIEQRRIHHAYLFSGVRGVGKTTAARILAKAINCIKGPTTEPCNECTMCVEITEGIDLDVREIDAATYTGVDNIRELREVTQFQPARDRYRIFIIDEAHMLSTPAWNALLKILEEPPPFVVFMFATTEVQKVPATILSRVQKFALRKITLDELIARLRQIGEAEGIKADDDALEIVARRGEGSVRDALSLLDQVVAFSGRTLSAADVATVLGLSDTTFFARLITLIAEGNHGAILEALHEAAESGRDFKLLYRDLLNFTRNLLLITGGASESMLSASREDLATIRSVSETFSYTELLRIANLLLKDDETVNRAEHQRLAVEIALLKAATFPRLREVEAAISSGAATGRPSPGLRPPSPRDEESGQGEGSSPDFFAERLQKARPLLAGYLSGAKSSRVEGNKIIWTFEDQHFAQPLVDAKSTLEQIAAEVYGKPMQIAIETSEGGSAKHEEPSRQSVREDPIVKAFAKHLGGEVVREKR